MENIRSKSLMDDNCRYQARQEQTSKQTHWIYNAKMLMLLALKPGPFECQCCIRTETVVVYCILKNTEDVLMRSPFCSVL